MRLIYRAAQTSVTIARFLNAAFHFSGAVLLILLALWVQQQFGRNWVLTLVAVLVGFKGALLGVRAAEIFLTTRPPEPPSQHRQSPRVVTRNRRDTHD